MRAWEEDGIHCQKSEATRVQQLGGQDNCNSYAPAEPHLPFSSGADPGCEPRVRKAQCPRMCQILSGPMFILTRLQLTQRATGVHIARTG